MILKHINIKKGKKNSWFNFKPSILVAGLVLFSIMLLITTLTNYSQKRLIPISVFALIAGIVFENRRLSQNWSTTIYSALISFGLSFFSFCPGRHESVYNFENHIQIWIYSFIFFFVIFGIAFNKEKIIPKLSEGITLLQSIAILYWVIDSNIISSNNSVIILLSIIFLVFVMYSFFNAFTYIKLSSTNRFILSIWSSIIMVCFAVDNIYRVYQNEQIENATNLMQSFFIGLQYFLLGVCSIYIVQNILMLIGFLPGKRTFFNEKYFKEIKELRNEHILRFSDIQINKLDSLFCLVLVGTFFVLNYFFKILSRNVAIWIIFVSFPNIIMLYNYLKKSKINDSATL